MLLTDKIFRRSLIITGLISLALWLCLRPWIDSLDTIALAGTEYRILAPSWLFLLSLIPFFGFMTIYSLTDVSKFQHVFSVVLRSALWASLCVALSRPVSTSTDTKVATILLVDVSSSISDEQLEASKNYVASIIEEKSRENKVITVSFAKYPKVIASNDAKDIERHSEPHHSNIEAALQLSYGLLPEGYIPHIVVVSDGQETQGDLRVEAERARDLGIRLSTKTFPKKEADDVRVAALQVPDEVNVGAPFEIRANIWSNHEEEVTATLRQNNVLNPLEPRKKMTLVPGDNWMTFKTQASKEGPTRFKLSLSDLTRDSNPANNTSTLATHVKGRPQILYIEGSAANNPASARYLKQALETESMSVEIRSPRGLPTSQEAYAVFDLVVLSDVGIEFVGNSQMRALEGYVKNTGGGLIMSGGENSFGSGGYQGTRMEAIMPVRFDGEKMREQARVAISLVIDRSGSMMGSKLEAAKASARATAEVLSSFDMLEVIAFDQLPTTLVRMQRASNRMKISSDISKLTAGGGTEIRGALAQAHQDLLTTDAKVKHVILLSDGHAPFSGIAELVRDMRADRVTVSAVGIGDADRSLLQMIVDNGDGRLYMTDDLSALPRIFMKETTEAQRNALVELPVKARIAKQVAMIEGTGVQNAPRLRGYVSVKAKPTSEVILVSDQGEPLLARWKVGLGTSVAWTSDVKNRWATDWLRWAGFPKFWAQVVRSSMRRKMYDSYDLSTSILGDKTRVVVNAVDANDRFVNGLETKLTIVDPATDKTIQTLDMKQDAAGRYIAEVSMDRYGSFLLKAVHRRQDKIVAESTGSVTLPYHREFMLIGTHTELLADVSKSSGGTMELDPKDAFDTHGASIERQKERWPWLLLLSILLLVMDTFLKRVRIFGHRAKAFS